MSSCHGSEKLSTLNDGRNDLFTHEGNNFQSKYKLYTLAESDIGM